MGCSAPVRRSRAGEGDVDGLGGQGGVCRTGAGGLLEQALDQLLEGFESLAYGLLGVGRSGLEPAAGDLVEQALLAAQPAQPKGLDVGIVRDRGSVGAGLLFDCGERLVSAASSNAVRLGIS